jgi:hypothetical protein
MSMEIDSAPRIPRLIHQTWKDHDVPEKWRAWSESWLQFNPEWEYRLWTDADCRRFVAEHYRWFLPIYDGYAATISRVDAVRYFLLDYFGGLYVDLDFECLRPMDGVLDGRTLVLGCEPPAHTRLVSMRRRGLDRIVGNALMASVPGHPFWQHAHRELVASHLLVEPLDVAGPLYLTRAVDSAPESADISVLPADVFYPDASPAAVQTLGVRNGDRGESYAVHHWAGSWTKDPNWVPRPSSRRTIPVRATQKLQPMVDGQLNLDGQRARWAAGETQPMVSCLMVTKDRPELAERAIRCFKAQTYPERELIIVDDSAESVLETAGDPRIRHHRRPDDGRALGELRNLAVELAHGPYVCQWDDDDLSDPERIEVQMAAIQAFAADASMLSREQLWWPDRRWFAISGIYPWEGSMICAKDKLPRYPELRRGEDTPVVRHVVSTGRVVAVSAPDLYTYVVHGGNTFDEKHFEQIFAAASETAEGDQYGDAMRRLAARVPIDARHLADDAAGD